MHFEVMASLMGLPPNPADFITNIYVMMNNFPCSVEWTPSFQDVLRCNVCDTPVPPLCCQQCDKNLCKTCAGYHLLDDTKEHKVVPIKPKLVPNKPYVSETLAKHCGLYCKHCDNSICVMCFS